MYTAKVAVCSEIRTNARQAACRIFECSTRWYIKNPLGLRRLVHWVNM